MTKSRSCSVAKFLLLVVTLTCAMVQVGVSSEASRPIVTVEVFSPLGLSTFRADRQSTYTFTASWQFSTSAPSSNADLYFGMLSPDLKTAYTWTRQDGSYVLVKGMHPFMEGISMNTPATYSTLGIAGKDLRYTVAGTQQLGMYIVFALIVGAGKNPADHSNWAQIEMKPLFVQQLVLP